MAVGDDRMMVGGMLTCVDSLMAITAMSHGLLLSSSWHIPGKIIPNLLPSKLIHKDLFALFFMLAFMGFYESTSSKQGVV